MICQPKTSIQKFRFIIFSCSLHLSDFHFNNIGEYDKRMFHSVLVLAPPLSKRLAPVDGCAHTCRCKASRTAGSHVMISPPWEIRDCCWVFGAVITSFFTLISLSRIYNIGNQFQKAGSGKRNKISVCMSFSCIWWEAMFSCL